MGMHFEDALHTFLRMNAAQIDRMPLENKNMAFALDRLLNAAQLSPDC
jgi:hypothetical protein